MVRASSETSCFWLTRLMEKMVQARLSSFVRYTGAAGIGCLGIILGFSFTEITGMVGVPFAILATVIAAIFGGFGPGILASVISALSVDFYFVSSFYDLRVTYGGVLRVVVFAFISILVSILISSLRSAFARTEEARVQSDKSNQEKDAVIGFLSHDLKGPLSSASLSFQLIQRYLEVGGKEAEIQRVAANGLFFCGRMTQLIQNLLDASKIKSGGIALAPQWQNLGDIVSEVFAEHRLLAEEKGIRYSLDCPKDTAFYVSCDKVLLGQVLANLILNAFKFTEPRDSVQIKLMDQGKWLVIQVIDTGLGISKIELPYVFDKFWQSPKNSKDGTGLGLFISRAIVEAHRGKISVASESGKGSTFTILLPKCAHKGATANKGQVSLCTLNSEKTA